jgi:hypothetical protein
MDITNKESVCILIIDSGDLRDFLHFGISLRCGRSTIRKYDSGDYNVLNGIELLSM